jgi:phosphoribosylformylglycinamidine (FGAM) synthase-like enzyme
LRSDKIFGGFINLSKKEQVLAFVVLMLVFGSLVLAVIDPSTGGIFTDLTKVAVGTYISFHIPTPNQRNRTYVQDYKSGGNS